MFSLDESTHWLFFSIFPWAVWGVRTSHVYDRQTFSSSVKTTCLFTECLVTKEKYPSVFSIYFLLKIRKIDFPFPSKNKLMSNREDFQSWKIKSAKQYELAQCAFQSDIWTVLESWKLPFPLYFVLQHSAYQ